MPADDTKLVVASHNTHRTKPKSGVPPLHSAPLELVILHDLRIDDLMFRWRPDLR